MQESGGQTGDYRKPLRTVGTVLIVVGILDILWMVYCIRAGMGYQSSFNVFAVIAGILLRRGSLKVARGVAFLSALMLTGFSSLPLGIAAVLPPDLVWTYLRLRPLPVAGWLLAVGCVVWLLAWVYQTLMTHAVLSAMDEKRIEYKRFMSRPSSGFIAGAALVILLVVLGKAIPGGENVERAEMVARNEVGEGYKFYVSSWSEHYSGSVRVMTAEVTAYNEREIRELEVRWAE